MKNKRGNTAEFVRRLVCVPASRYQALNRIAKNGVFAAPPIDNIKTLEALRGEVAKAIAEGETGRTFALRAMEVLRHCGSFALDKKQAEDLLHSYAMLAYANEKRVAMMDSAVLAVMPYWQFRTCGDGAVCCVCASLDLFTAKWDDEVWRAVFPPLERTCRCTVIPLSNSEVDEAAHRPAIDRLPKFAKTYVLE